MAVGIVLESDMPGPEYISKSNGLEELCTSDFGISKFYFRHVKRDADKTYMTMPRNYNIILVSCYFCTTRRNLLLVVENSRPNESHNCQHI